MTVILNKPSRQPAVRHRHRRLLPPGALLVGLALAATALAADTRWETHWNLQSVTGTGTSAWTGTTPFTVLGVLLTDPDEMLDPTPDFIPYTGPDDMFRLGGQWQVVVQAALAGDRGGTSLWMGQNYGNHPANLGEEFSYSNEAWLAEIQRVSHDPATGHAFRKGDLVAVTANRSLFFGGKRNINEAHSIEPDASFHLSLVMPKHGLPAPEVLSLSSLVRPDDGDPGTSEDIFDPTRASGGEHWQGMRVRLTSLEMVDSSGWNAAAPWGGRSSRVTDGEGRFFTLRHPRYDLGPAPTAPFDAVGIINQESGSGSQGVTGYELFVQEILPVEEPALEIASKAVIAWPASRSNYQLRSATSVDGPYHPMTNAPVGWDGKHAILQEPTEAQRSFYRLERSQ
jgi:hypothetical protein